MEINPFIISGKIKPQFFCDREYESETLIKFIKNQNNVLLISPRRMGKTELIKHCFDKEELKKDYYTFFIDILQTTSLREFTFLLGREIYDTLLPRSKKIADNFLRLLRSINGTFSYDPVSGFPAFNISIGQIANPEFTLKEIFQFLEKANKRCVLAIDEFQQITKYPEKNVEAILRTHIQNCTNSNFIFAGSRRHILNEMFFYVSRPFYQSASVIDLKSIPEDIYNQFVVKLFKDFEKQIDPKNITKIYNLFDGFTFYMQRVFNQAFANTAEGEKCDLEKIRHALDYSVSINSSIYREILSNIPERQKEVLFAIAKEGKVKQPMSGDFIKSNTLLSASSVQGALRKLLEIDLLTKEDNIYSVNDKFLELWIKSCYDTPIHLL